ncbi:cytochrome c oxidase assembly protein subunit 15 [Paenibacillus phyllosphaerae]|uniref:Cytochrome c oxidase assembly protein subunit 15 n=1 Tax=Paenibacillus phyllosphaerae TaxID=274593 RepID=A0A7W5FP70_9BACL|nr:heme A synthase [Paenibacillus phyllosphaerae]MBB3111734.1 cytochrome c oxidase assembly protein subunit 15 [Paenibacillus phyllosphaerae]
MKKLSYLTTLFMFLATFGGGVVTRTESGLGCGSEWPLCHGKFVPAHTLASVIEYTHRLVSSTAGILAVLTLVLFLVYKTKRKDLVLFSVLTVIFVTIQGAMGALAVVFTQSPPIMALHLGFAFISLASSLMTSLGARQEERLGGLAAYQHMPRIRKGFRILVWATAIYSYIVVYTGAFVSHTDSAGACAGFPLCNGEIVPELTGSVGIAFFHRLAGYLLVVLIAVLCYYLFRYYGHIREFRILGYLSITLILFQVLSGASLMVTMGRPEVYMFVVLAHVTSIAILFGVLSYMSYLVWRLSKPAAA